MKKYPPIDPVTDAQADLIQRIEALNLFLDRAEKIVQFLIEQLESELSRDDTRFVIYLFGAIRKVYDRRSIPPLIKILHDGEVELTFRMQCIAVLRELYRISVANPGLIAGGIRSGPIDDPTLDITFNISQQVDENFRIFGEDLNNEDRQEIENALRKIAENPDEVQPFRGEAQSALEITRDLKEVKADFIYKS